MLFQSHTGTIHLFPAIPENWLDVSFEQLRAEGAFLTSAVRQKGKVLNVNTRFTKEGELKLRNPFGKSIFSCSQKYRVEDSNIIIIETK